MEKKSKAIICRKTKTYKQMSLQLRGSAANNIHTPVYEASPDLTPMCATDDWGGVCTVPEGQWFVHG